MMTTRRALQEWLQLPWWQWWLKWWQQCSDDKKKSITIHGLQSQHRYNTWCADRYKVNNVGKCILTFSANLRNHIRLHFLLCCIFFGKILLYPCQKNLTFSENLRNYTRLQQECKGSHRQFVQESTNWKKLEIFSANLINHIHPHPWHAVSALGTASHSRGKQKKCRRKVFFPEKCVICGLAEDSHCSTTSCC